MPRMTSKKGGCNTSTHNNHQHSRKEGGGGSHGGGGVCRKCGNGGGHGGGNGGGGNGFKKGPWTAAEDALLIEYVKKHGERHWNCVQKTGLMRCGKSCRLRWTNHLRPDLKKGVFTPEEERIVLNLHAKLGNKWSKIAAELPGRTDNEVKNFWNTKIKRRMKANLLTINSDGNHQQKESVAFHHHLQQQKSQKDSIIQQGLIPSLSNSIYTPHSSFSPFTTPTSYQLMISSTQDDNDDPILSFLNNPAYKYKFLADDQEEGSYNNYNNNNYINNNNNNNDNVGSFSMPFSSVPRITSPIIFPTNSYQHSISLDNNIGSSTSNKMELPSNQINYGNYETWTSSSLGKNSEVEKSSITEEGKAVGDVALDDDRSPVMSCNGLKNPLKQESLEEMVSMDDDLSSLLHDFSSVGPPPPGPLYYMGRDICMATIDNRKEGPSAITTPVPPAIFNCHNMDNYWWNNM